MNKGKLLLRLIVSPLVFGIILTAYLYSSIKRFIEYIRWGGELMIHKVDEKASMELIWQQLKKNQINSTTEE